MSRIEVSEQLAASGVKAVSIEAVIFRADGTIEDLGEIAYWHRNPLRRAFHALREAVRR